MAHVRRRGAKWQAIITLPDGRQTSRTDPLKKVVQAWAAEVEAQLRRDTWNDPRPGRAMTVEEWRTEWMRHRIVEPVTARKDASRWNVRVGPRWADTRLAHLRRSDIQTWVAEMTAAGVQPHSVAAAVNHLGAILQGAVEAEPPLLAANPARGVKLPRTDVGRVRFFTHAEYARIEAELTEPYRTLMETACYAGLRWGELAGLDARHVDLERGEIHVRQVLTRLGLRPYAKSARSHRTVPLTDHLTGALADLAGRQHGGLVFLREGKALDESNHRQRVWGPALRRAGIAHAPFHTTRHTAASWLVMAGVDLYRVQALLGHESYRTTEKYAHLAPDAHDAVRAAWAAMPGQAVGKMGPSEQTTSADTGLRVVRDEKPA